MSQQASSEGPRRGEFAQLIVIDTRWDDNDVYGHLNNAKYYGFFDTAINRWLIAQGGLDPAGGEVIGFCAESHCRYLRALGFPKPVEVGLRVAKLGNASVRYELALFDEESELAAATGWFVHVFVDRSGRRPTAIPEKLRAALKQLELEGAEPRP